MPLTYIVEWERRVAQWHPQCDTIYVISNNIWCHLHAAKYICIYAYTHIYVLDIYEYRYIQCRGMVWQNAYQPDNREGREGKRQKLRDGQRRLQLCMQYFGFFLGGGAHSWPAEVPGPVIEPKPQQGQHWIPNHYATSTPPEPISLKKKVAGSSCCGKVGWKDQARYCCSCGVGCSYSLASIHSLGVSICWGFGH